MTLFASITTKLYIPYCLHWPDRSTKEKNRVSISHSYSVSTYMKVENGRRLFRSVNVFQTDHVCAQLDLVLGRKRFFRIGHSELRRFSNLEEFPEHT
jgi:hypothetical protein